MRVASAGRAAVCLSCSVLIVRAKRLSSFVLANALQDPLHYPHGTKFLAPGPLGQCHPIPGEQAWLTCSTMFSWPACNHTLVRMLCVISSTFLSANWSEVHRLDVSGMWA